MSGAGLHYRRNSWLLVFGLVHAYLIWHGDILVTYALCGMLLYPLRNLEPRRLLRIGGCAVGFVVLLWGVAQLSIPYWPEADRMAAAAEWAPPRQNLDAEIAAFRGGPGEQVAARAPIALALQTTALLGMLLWRAGGMMLVGMGLYKLGVVSAQRSMAFYRRLVVVGLAAGLPLAAAGTAYKIHVDFAWDRAMFQGGLFNYIGSIGVFLAYLGLVMLIVKSGRLPRLQPAPGRDRAHGADQLHHPEPDLFAGVLRAWAGALRARRGAGPGGDRGRDMAAPAGLVALVAGALPVRAA